MRIGIVGTENSHTDYYLRALNQERRHPGHRVTALVGGTSERNLELARADSGVELVDDVCDLIGHVDAAIVCSRDGRRHRAEATTLIDAGLPVFVDKPLACSVADAQAILAAARQAAVPVSSYSSLRWLPVVTDLADRIASAAEAPKRLEVVGPADPASPYAGIWFYGIHVVEIALTLLPGRTVTDIAVRTAPGEVHVSAQAGSTELSLTLLRPGPEGLPPWRMTADGEQRELVLDPDYGAPGVAQLVRMLESGQSPLSEAELIAPIELLAVIADALTDAS